MGKFAWGYNVSGNTRVLTILFLEDENSFLERETYASDESNPDFTTQRAWFTELPGVKEVEPSELDPDSKWEEKEEL